MTLLALDLATKTGFAVGNPDAYQCVTPLEAAAGSVPKPYSGVFTIAPPRTSIGEFMARYRDWLDDMITLHGVDKLVFEAPIITSGRTSIDTARKLLGVAAVTEELAYRRGIPWVREGNNATIRKHFIGKGRGDRKDLKRLVLEQCRARGWEVDSEDEGDALALFDFGVHCINSQKRAA